MVLGYFPTSPPSPVAMGVVSIIKNITLDMKMNCKINIIIAIDRLIFLYKCCFFWIRYLRFVLVNFYEVLAGEAIAGTENVNKNFAYKFHGSM